MLNCFLAQKQSLAWNSKATSSFLMSHTKIWTGTTQLFGIEPESGSNLLKK